MAGSEAAEKGYSQVLWLDAIEGRYVEEVGAMNIFFRIGDTIVTPELRGTILPGVTRDSVITLLRESGREVEDPLAGVVGLGPWSGRRDYTFWRWRRGC